MSHRISYSDAQCISPNARLSTLPYSKNPPFFSRLSFAYQTLNILYSQSGLNWAAKYPTQSIVHPLIGHDKDRLRERYNSEYDSEYDLIIRHKHGRLPLDFFASSLFHMDSIKQYLYFALVLAFVLYRANQRANKARQEREETKHKQKEKEKAGGDSSGKSGGHATQTRTPDRDPPATWSVIEAVSDDFDIATCAPRPYRPFKAGKYHLTMGLQKCDASDWILLENTYKRRTAYRRKQLKEHPEIACLVQEGPEVDAAVHEYYEYMWYYLSERYPKYFTKETVDGVEWCHNSLWDEKYPMSAQKCLDLGLAKGSRDLAMICSSTHEEDFLLMTLDETHDPPMYRMRAVSSCFPAGFNPADKIGLTLRNIHGPVPGYKQRLDLSMNKFFAKFQAGNFVQRQNWGIQCDDALFDYENYAGFDAEKDNEPYEAHEVDFNEWALRVERQVLTRLPKTGAMCFVIRCYTTPVSVIREEPRAPDLIDAIDQLPIEDKVYKGAHVWGPVLQQYLRREVEGKGVGDNPIERIC